MRIICVPLFGIDCFWHVFPPGGVRIDRQRALYVFANSTCLMSHRVHVSAFSKINMYFDPILTQNGPQFWMSQMRKILYYECVCAGKPFQIAENLVTTKLCIYAHGYAHAPRCRQQIYHHGVSHTTTNSVLWPNFHAKNDPILDLSNEDHVCPSLWNRLLSTHISAR